MQKNEYTKIAVIAKWKRNQLKINKKKLKYKIWCAIELESDNFLFSKINSKIQFKIHMRCFRNWIRAQQSLPNRFVSFRFGCYVKLQYIQ